ncbi:HPr kinase/phosphorylase [Fredinandcohnia quinoae]|uniref:Aldolase n=1 Tax=Fredinandcohnia quinoae TaxID=2918902 RepID=A0AAW5E0R6_9BACI|nr:aldolase [Fredinandcohnia sp. SECRCQ15]MCH1624875.1 aldolase [Fredinandcohnia sp. SECRCQ15]
MLHTINTVMYKAFGFRILSEINLPELIVIEDNKSQRDIEIILGNLKNQWEKIANPKRNFYVKDNLVMFRVKDVAIYSIIDGERIVVSPAKEAKEDKIRLYLLGTCMGIMMMQRRILPLHGSAVIINGKAYAIVGDSGAGKSTLASALLHRGFQLISDDLIPVTLNNSGIPVVTSAYPQQKLWQESLQEFGIESKHLRPIIDRETKFAVPVISQFIDREEIPLAGIYELLKTEKESIELYPVNRFNKVDTLLYHTYRNFLLQPLGLFEWHFSMMTTMMKHTEVYQLKRPVSTFTAHDLASIILSTIVKE